LPRGGFGQGFAQFDGLTSSIVNAPDELKIRKKQNADLDGKLVDLQIDQLQAWAEVGH